MKKKFVVILACAFAAMLCLAFAGCGGGGNSTTKYVGTEVEMFGMTMAMDEVYGEGENYAELSSDGSCVVCIDGDQIEGTWTQDGENVNVVLTDSTGDYDCPGTLVGDTLTIDLAGAGLNLIFVAE